MLRLRSLWSGRSSKDGWILVYVKKEKGALSKSNPYTKFQTIEKIQILGKDYKDVLLKQIPAENLPTFLGGECTCSHMPGGCVPSQGTWTG